MNKLVLSVAFKTIGCKVNQYETVNLRQIFYKNGYQIKNFDEKADIYVINTCAVTHEAERKSRQMIRRASRLNPSGFIVVTGCAIQSNLQEIKKCKNDNNYYIVSNYYKDSIFNLLNKTLSNPDKSHIFYKTASQITSYPENQQCSMSNRIRGLVKIQDGCNQFCSYCIIPYLRGRARSRAPEDILSEIKKMASNGYKEIVLLGINLGYYGIDLQDKNINLSKLIQEIEKIPQIERIRLSSIELQWINDELINVFYNSSKLCHHLHIPLQSGDDDVLSLMCRRYNIKQFKNLVEKIREKIPFIAITSDVIVGFPGESDLSFQKTYNFIEDTKFSKIHVFPYSERPFNLASLLPNRVNPDIIKNRTKLLNLLSKKLQKSFFIKNIGQEKNVLIEYNFQKDNHDYICGLTDNYIRVITVKLQTNKGEMIKLKLKNVLDSCMEGEISI